MPSIVLAFRYAVKERLLKNLRRCHKAEVRQRYLIVINVINGRSARATAAVLQIHKTPRFTEWWIVFEPMAKLVWLMPR